MFVNERIGALVEVALAISLAAQVSSVIRANAAEVARDTLDAELVPRYIETMVPFLAVGFFDGSRVFEENSKEAK